MTTTPHRRRRPIVVAVAVMTALAVAATAAACSSPSSTAGRQPTTATPPTASNLSAATSAPISTPSSTATTSPTNTSTAMTSPGADVPAPALAWPLRGDGTPTAGGVALKPESGAAWSAEGATFNGQGGAVTTEPVDLDPSADFTVTAWVRADPGIGAFATAVGQLGDVAGSFFLGRSNNAWSFVLKEKDANGKQAVTNRAESAPSNVTAGTWVHLAGVWDATLVTATLYVNGVKAADVVSGVPFAAHGPISIGRAQSQGKPSDFWLGTVADVRIFPAVVQADEVDAVAHDGPPAGADFAPPPATTPCTFPEGGGCLGELTAGEHFTRAMTPEFGYSVPHGWTNAQDLAGQYLLTTTGSDPTADYLAVYQRVSGAVQDCSDDVDPKAGTTPEAYVSWLRGLPGVAVSGPRSTAVGGLSALMVDLRAKPGITSWPCVDGDVRVIPILIGGPGDTDFFNHAIGAITSTGQTIGMRLYLFTWNGGLSAIEVSTIGDSQHQSAFAKAAEPVIASIRFTPS